MRRDGEACQVLFFVKRFGSKGCVKVVRSFLVGNEFGKAGV